MARSERPDWKIPRGYQSDDHLQLAFWKDGGEPYLDAGAVEKHMGRQQRDTEDGLLSSHDTKDIRASSEASLEWDWVRSV